MKRNFIKLIAVLLTATPLMTYAISTVEDVGGVITRIINVLIAIFWAIVIAFGLLTSIRYLTAGGDAEKIKKAKAALVYLIIAIAIAVSITVIKTVLINLLGGELPPPIIPPQ